MRSNKLIPLSAFVVAGTITLAEIQTHHRLPTINQWLGIAIAFLLMSIIADLGSNLGGGLAVLVMLSVVLSRGDEALGYAQSKVRTKGTKGKRKPDSGFGIIGENVEVL